MPEMSDLRPVPDGDDDEPVDPFDPEALRIDGLADVEVEKVLTVVPVRRPGRTEFFRVHPDWQVDVRLLEHVEVGGISRETYLVDQAVQHLVASELRVCRLYTCINKRGDVFLWAAVIPDDNNPRGRRWAETRLMAAEQAKTLWVKLIANTGLGGYEYARAKGDLGDPQWPADKAHRDLLQLAFQDRRIDRPDHPVILDLHGEL